MKSRLSVHLSHGPAGRTLSFDSGEKGSSREIEDVNTIWFVKAKGRDSEESQSLSTQGSNIEDDDEKRVFSASCPICDGCDAGR